MRTAARAVIIEYAAGANGSAKLMPITFTLPADIERNLRQEWTDLDQAAKEAFVIHGYNTGKLSLGYVAQILGLDTSIQAQEWLARQGVPLNYSSEDLEADRQTLARLFGTAD
jgi:predicted HTH domain antitoxin